MPFPEPQKQAVARAAGKGARVEWGELLALTSIRGIAAWWVVLFHMRLLLVPWLPVGAIRVLDHGNLAVDLFFVLSGFVIALNYGERLAGDWRATGDFLFRRFARIYPLHLLILGGFALYAGGAILFGSATLAGQDPGYFLASLFLVQNWGFTDALRWNVPAWSISTEALAYLLFPVLVRLLPAIRRSSRRCAPAGRAGWSSSVFGSSANWGPMRGSSSSLMRATICTARTSTTSSPTSKRFWQRPSGGRPRHFWRMEQGMFGRARAHR